MPQSDLDVLIIGAGPAGSALAADLLRRRVTVRIVDRAEHSFDGSRAKGVQPRTQEILDDLGVLKEARELGSPYPLVGLHLGPVTVPVRMQPNHRATSDVPYPNALLLPQDRTDAVLHRLLERGGVSIEYGSAFSTMKQDSASVTTELTTGEVIHSRYLIGADGGGSAVRRAAGITFVGETDPADRMLIVDASVDGLSRRRWHMWPGRRGRGTAACPLPDGTRFQVMIRLRADEEVDLGDEAIAARFRLSTGRRLHDITWRSVFRPNVRLADHYRAGRVLLVGDAAHVHTPAGGQGLNTGIQDANNLGWKLGQVLAGADDALLESYEAERRPVAADVLALSSALYAKLGSSTPQALRRGDAERQLSVSYSGGPLAPSGGGATGAVRAGDRAPDAECVAEGVSHLFDVYRGPQFTLLAFGAAAEFAADSLPWPATGASLRVVHVRPKADGELRSLEDTTGDIHRRYGVTGDALILVRPDGYVAAIETTEFPGRIREARTILSPV
ncbi:FAD-binding monooxygenase (plasmid) [Rathayibacter sp. VKM Ac-2803]|uniref:FAD-binding monooxygenase n=1 Tax=Rathayibacter caricis DSM 15933 TaxID=1328867 RepID=A0A2T4UNT3_9MICO|nr:MULTISPECIES: FAD-dependent monooxygenase [Rathayibacter]MWV51570.1 FAD-binding monooxygenase [Rathayibacter sp. VKM Ac-2803]PTL71171.1 FAD-binding monooxygenase [Rathayibacter caricis DSM 15933]